MSKIREHINEGKMWLDAAGKWCKKCPSCNSIIIGKDGTTTTKFNVSHSIIKQKICHSCVKIGKPTWASLNRKEFGKMITGDKHPMYGKHHTNEMKIKQRNRYLGTKLSNITKQRVSDSIKKVWKNPIVRKKYLDALQKTKWLKVRTDIGQKELIDKWNNLGFNFQINYQLKTDNFLCYIDGYDAIHNVVLEYDSQYHNKESQKKKDLYRQEQIMSILKPKKFWRYNCDNNLFSLYLYTDMPDRNKQQPSTVVD